MCQSILTSSTKHWSSYTQLLPYNHSRCRALKSLDQLTHHLQEVHWFMLVIINSFSKCLKLFRSKTSKSQTWLYSSSTKFTCSACQDGSCTTMDFYSLVKPYIGCVTNTEFRTLLLWLTIPL